MRLGTSIDWRAGIGRLAAVVWSSDGRVRRVQRRERQQYAVDRRHEAGGGRAAPADRKYLLERVDDAAVVQLYADGFEKLPLDEKTLIWHLYQAALAGRDIYLRPALRPQPRDARRARGDHHAPARTSIRQTLAEIQRYTKLFWINTGPYNNLTARKFVLKCTPEAFAAAATAAQKAGAKFPLQGGRDARRAADAAAAALLRR